MNDAAALIRVDGLSLVYRQERGGLEAARNVTFDIWPGESQTAVIAPILRWNALLQGSFHTPSTYPDRRDARQVNLSPPRSHN